MFACPHPAQLGPDRIVHLQVSGIERRYRPCRYAAAVADYFDLSQVSLSFPYPKPQGSSTGYLAVWHIYTGPVNASHELAVTASWKRARITFGLQAP